MRPPRVTQDHGNCRGQGLRLEQTLPGQGCRSSGLGGPRGPCLTLGKPSHDPPPPGPTLTSSIRIRGFSVLVFFRHWMIFPGMAPTYVRLGEGTVGWSGPRQPEVATPHNRPSCLGAPGPQCVPRARPSCPKWQWGNGQRGTVRPDECWQLPPVPGCRALGHPNTLPRVDSGQGTATHSQVSLRPVTPCPVWTSHLDRETQQNRRHQTQPGTGSKNIPHTGVPGAVTGPTRHFQEYVPMSHLLCPSWATNAWHPQEANQR